MFDVFYKDLNLGFLKKYCVCKSDFLTALLAGLRFNRKYPGKPYPNGKGLYNYSNATIKRQGLVRGDRDETLERYSYLFRPDI